MQGKQPHMASATEFLTLQFGASISRESTLLVDDDAVLWPVPVVGIPFDPLGEAGRLKEWARRQCEYAVVAYSCYSNL